METGELLKTLRQIVREETVLAMDSLGKRMDARFDQVNTWFDGVYIRLERLEMEGQAIKAALARLGFRGCRSEGVYRQTRRGKPAQSGQNALPDCAAGARIARAAEGGVAEKRPFARWG